MDMKQVRLEKVTLNVGSGSAREKMQNGKDLLERITGQTPVFTKAKVRNPTWKIKQGDLIGVKVTLRGEKAADVLKKSLDTVDNRLPATSFDSRGNFSFGVKEYIDYPGMKYDPKIGMMGFDVCVSLTRPGARVARRRIAKSRIPPKQVIKADEAREFVKKTFSVELSE